MNLVNEGVLPPDELDDRDERREEREVAQERETVTDIVADIRERAYNATRHGERTTDNYAVSELLKSIADRIEAAWKRERSAWKDLNDIAYEMLKHEKDDANRRVEEVSRQVGNAAAMREALCDIVMLTMKARYSIHGDVACGIIASKAKHALSAPARQCDVGTAEEQAERHSRFCISQHGHCKRCPAHRRTHNGCVLAWAQMPYEAEEGGAK